MPAARRRVRAAAASAGHGVDPDLIAQVTAASRGFFSLPSAEKLAIEMVKSPQERTRPDATIPVIPLPDALKSHQRGLSVDQLNPIFREVERNQLKSRLRSHPDVSRAHHADLLADAD